MALLHRTIPVAALALSVGLVPLDARTGAAQVLSMTTPSGSVTAFLTVPPGIARPPVVILMSPAAKDLAVALATEGVASLQVDGAADAAIIANWFALVRNDGRFPTTSLFAEGVGVEGAGLARAVIAARAARIDGVVTRNDAGDATPEIARVAGAKLTIAPAPVAETATRIAEFARTVPVLGRRGTSAARPDTARRSPRQVLLATIGAARIGIEWGAPQKRGRDIWGALVRWNEVWMPGADEATTLTTNVPITIGTLTVPAGDHTFYTLPGPERLQLIVSNDVGQFHTVHDAGRELGRMDMRAGTRPDSVEGLTFSIEPREHGGALKIAWDTREFSVPVSVPSTTQSFR